MMINLVWWGNSWIDTIAVGGFESWKGEFVVCYHNTGMKYSYFQQYKGRGIVLMFLAIFAEI